MFAKPKSFLIYLVLYECKAPSENEIDQKGFRQLIYKKYIRFGITKEALKEILRKEREAGRPLKNRLKPLYRDWETIGRAHV